jgi:glycosyltransferase involved in cell wall biosynthesis
MKILLVHNSYREPGGEDVVFEEEAQLLERAGHTVIQYKRSNQELDGWGGFKNATVVVRMPWAPDARRDIADLLRIEKPDLAHIHNTFLMISPSIYWACRAAAVPVVQTLHNFRLLCPAATFFRDGRVCEECEEQSLWSGVRHACYHESRATTAAVALMLSLHRWIDTSATMVDRYIALSNFALQKFAAGGLPETKLSVKPNFIGEDPGERVEDGDFALFVGRLGENKGVKALILAWERLANPVPLLVLGDGPLRAGLEIEASRHSGSRITFAGQVARTNVIGAMRRARFLVCPSECYENFPMSFIEAFACGVPVICSRLGAMKEIVVDGQTGLHFTAGDPDDLAKIIDWAWTNPHEMVRMGRNARREYETKYTAQRNYEMLMEIYRRAQGVYDNGIHSY